LLSEMINERKMVADSRIDNKGEAIRLAGKCLYDEDYIDDIAEDHTDEVLRIVLKMSSESSS